MLFPTTRTSPEFMDNECASWHHSGYKAQQASFLKCYKRTCSGNKVTTWEICISEHLPFLTRIIYIIFQENLHVRNIWQRTQKRCFQERFLTTALEDCLDWCPKTLMQFLSVPLDQLEVAQQRFLSIPATLQIPIQSKISTRIRTHT